MSNNQDKEKWSSHCSFLMQLFLGSQDLPIISNININTNIQVIFKHFAFNEKSENESEFWAIKIDLQGYCAILS